MSDHYYRKRTSYCFGPNGERITLADLPARSTKRWVARDKGRVVTAVQHGLMSFQEACERYNLSLDEYLSWQRTFERDDQSGLRATRIRKHRD